MKNEFVIGIGSNIDPGCHIPRAIKALTQKLDIIRQSPVVRTSPLGMTGCPDFENTALLARTSLSCEELRKALKSIERSLGRPAEHDKNSPRTIDLDILVFNGKVVDRDVLERAFLRDAIQYLLPEVL